MRSRFVISAIVSVALSGCVTSGGPGPAPRAAASPRNAAVVASASVRVTLSAQQSALVRPYLEGSTGRGRRGALPPGIARNLARGKSLPPGIAKSYLPAQIVAQLPRLPTGLDYVVVAGKLLLVEVATAAIHDVLMDIAFGR